MGVVTSFESISAAFEGHDTITSGLSSDRIIAGQGDDKITDGGGNNIIIGDRGSMAFVSGAPIRVSSETGVLSGSDTLTTTGGNDIIIAGGNADTINAGAGNNTILGTMARSALSMKSHLSVTLTVSTLDGNDSINSLGGADVIYTEMVITSSMQVLAMMTSSVAMAWISSTAKLATTLWSASFGDDTLDGGLDDDIVFGGNPLGTRSNYEFATNDFSMPPQYSTVEELFSSSVSSFGLPFITSGGYVPAVLITPTIVGELSVDGASGDGRDRLLGSDGNDVIFGGADVDHIEGGIGIDYIDAGSGNDINVDGGEGDDVVRGGYGRRRDPWWQWHRQSLRRCWRRSVIRRCGDATGRQAGQRLFGGEGRDTIFAYAPAMANQTAYFTQNGLAGDQLFGGGGGDTLSGNARREVLSGDDGNDVLHGRRGGWPELLNALGSRTWNNSRHFRGQ